MSDDTGEMTAAAARVGTHAPEVRAYVNERGVSVPAGSTAIDAVRAHSVELAEQVAAGEARLTDSRGLPVDAAHPVTGGFILRVLPVRARAQADYDGDAT